LEGGRTGSLGLHHAAVLADGDAPTRTVIAGPQAERAGGRARREVGHDIGAAGTEHERQQVAGQIGGQRAIVAQRAAQVPVVEGCLHQALSAGPGDGPHAAWVLTLLLKVGPRQAAGEPYELVGFALLAPGRGADRRYSWLA